ncbi:MULTISPECIES: polynucleotide adenylyltransferase PcnB [Vitreoscilla]|uniref:Poly(A) polymerase I n=1 Tax=Vitreoscilla stercoraria TaxID=61 RepID=A0ABY4E8V0_VITST|nr:MULTISPECIES: polynucleotide adenylyltransferase PcnB [Vitreoscilla]UOO91859.1 polynucleotide adenylyltransferase PcnB [Vitreoscilla stercoraria]
MNSKKKLSPLLTTDLPSLPVHIWDGNEFGLSLSRLSHAAQKVVKQLHQSGYDAMVVGGGVRDLLVGQSPKDFDIATNATPEEVKAVFKRSRIIGRRFRIVHVMMGAETIEVTTYRGGDQMQQNEQGRIMRDNTFGSQAEDALRRDFTCNALYYDAIANQVIDYHHGMADIQKRRLVMIGEPKQRFREDPVRVLRALRLSTKLGFELDDAIANVMAECAPWLAAEPPARLVDELIKLLLSGHALACLQNVRRFGIQANVHPFLQVLMTQDLNEPFIQLALKNTDLRIKQGKHVSVGFLLAALLWPKVRDQWQFFIASGLKKSMALSAAVESVREELDGSRWGLPHRMTAMCREIWQLQSQFDNQKGQRPYRLIAQPRFRAAYDFLLLRYEVGEADTEAALWWQRFQEVSTHEREAMVGTAARPYSEAVEAVVIEQPKKRRRRRRPKNTSMIHEN